MVRRGTLSVEMKGGSRGEEEKVSDFLETIL